jgi:hypothetical protein
VKFGPNLPHTSSGVGSQLQNCWGSCYLIWQLFLSSIETFTSTTPLGFAIISMLWQRCLGRPEEGWLRSQTAAVAEVSEGINLKYKLSSFKKYSSFNIEMDF